MSENNPFKEESPTNPNGDRNNEPQEVAPFTTFTPPKGDKPDESAGGTRMEMFSSDFEPPKDPGAPDNRQSGGTRNTK